VNWCIRNFCSWCPWYPEILLTGWWLTRRSGTEKSWKKLRSDPHSERRREGGHLRDKTVPCHAQHSLVQVVTTSLSCGTHLDRMGFRWHSCCTLFSTGSETKGRRSTRRIWTDWPWNTRTHSERSVLSKWGSLHRFTIISVCWQQVQRKIGSVTWVERVDFPDTWGGEIDVYLLKKIVSGTVQPDNSHWRQSTGLPGRLRTGMKW
jgi:hypothetical protein